MQCKHTIFTIVLMYWLIQNVLNYYVFFTECKGQTHTSYSKQCYYIGHYLHTKDINTPAYALKNREIKWFYAKRGTPLMVLACDDQWYRVADIDSEISWVPISSINLKYRVAMLNCDTQMYCYPNIGKKIIATIAKYTQVRILRCNDKWCKIKSNYKKGWVIKTQLWGSDLNCIKQCPNQ